MNKQFIRKAHRWLGLTFSLTILMSAGSGVIHNVMTRTQAPPPSARPSGNGLDVSQIKLSVRDAAIKLPDAAQGIAAVNVRSIGGQPWYQIYTKKNRAAQYVSALDGRVDPAQDEAYAAEIATTFLGGARRVSAHGFAVDRVLGRQAADHRTGGDWPRLPALHER